MSLFVPESLRASGTHPLSWSGFKKFPRALIRAREQIHSTGALGPMKNEELMSQMPREGETFAGHWKIVCLLSTGYAGSVFRATDLRSQKDYAIKVFPKRDDVSFRQYTDHLLSIRTALQGFDTGSLSLPVEEGETEDTIYQVYELIPQKFQSLRDIIRDRAPMRPEDALTLLARVAEPLATLETASVIHGDLKPENILVQRDAQDRVFLVDFGMMQQVEADQSLLLVGTRRYLHPDLGSLLSRQAEVNLTDMPRRLLGPYLDVYALGVIAIEMLTGGAHLPRPLTISALSSSLRSHNPYLAYADQQLVQSLSQLVLGMLSVEVARRINAKQVHSDSQRLLDAFRRVTTDAAAAAEEPSTPDSAEDAHRDAIGVGLAHAVESLHSIAESLETATDFMVQTARRLEPVVTEERDSAVLREMNTAFKNALARTNAAWRFGMGFSVVCFLLIVGMITCSVVLAVTTGKPGWSLIFGGASVPLVIGTLLWRPYDRAFRPTILAQQLEMIHVQSTSAFRSTADLDRRLEICREAMAGLQSLLEQHSREASDASRRRRTARKAPTTGSRRRGDPRA